VSQLIPWESVDVGTELGAVETDISERAMFAYQKDWDDPNPWYTEASPWGGPVAAPAFMAGLTGFNLLATRFNTRATVGVKTAHKNLAPVFTGQKMTTKGRLTDRYIKRRREYVVVESSSYDESGNEFRRSCDHIMLSFERSPFEDTVPPSPASPERDTQLVPTDPGLTVPTLTKVVYQRALATRTFSDDSSHNDDNAQRFGYAGALVSAYVLCGLMSEPMVHAFGESWFTTGDIALTFIGKGVQQGDKVTVAGSARELDSETNRATFGLTMSRGATVVVAGEASAALVRD
jgi:hypothetical protein